MYEWMNEWVNQCTTEWKSEWKKTEEAKYHCQKISFNLNFKQASTLEKCSSSPEIMSVGRSVSPSLKRWNRKSNFFLYHVASYQLVETTVRHKIFVKLSSPNYYWAYWRAVRLVAPYPACKHTIQDPSLDTKRWTKNLIPPFSAAQSFWKNR